MICIVKLGQGVSRMSEDGWSLLCLAAILILAGSKALVVLALVLAFGLVVIVIRLVVFMVKLVFRWVFGK